MISTVMQFPTPPTEAPPYPPVLHTLKQRPQLVVGHAGPVYPEIAFWPELAHIDHDQMEMTESWEESTRSLITTWNNQSSQNTSRLPKEVRYR